MDEGNINSKIVRFNERLFLAYFAVTFGLHYDHVLGWWEQRDDANILILTYEDRIKDPGYAVDKIAKFLGKKISPETRDLIIRQTSFEAMKSLEKLQFSFKSTFRRCLAFLKQNAWNRGTDY